MDDDPARGEKSLDAVRDRGCHRPRRCRSDGPVRARAPMLIAVVRPGRARRWVGTGRADSSASAAVHTGSRV